MEETNSTTSTTMVHSGVVEADMRWTVANHPPQVTLTFEGLQPPERVFADLRAIGWQVTSSPTPPREAIQWVPDPVKGTDHTVLPWRVTEFPIEKGAWDAAVETAIGALTYDLFRRNGVTVTGNTKIINEMEARWATNQQSAAQNQPGANASSVGDSAQPQTALPRQPLPAGPPQIILIDYTGPQGQDLVHAVGITGARSKTTIAWTQSSLALEELCPTEEVRAKVLGSSASAWMLRGFATAPTIQGGTTVCALVPDVAPGDKKMTKILASLGGTVQAGEVVSLDGRKPQTGSLIFGTIAANSFELVSSSLRLRFQQAVLRTTED